MKVGAEHHEQTAECLNLVVSLRHWKQHWCQERESLEGTFRQRCGMKLKGTAPVMNRIGSELALDLGEATFRPDVCVTRQGSRLTSLTAFQGSFVLAVVWWFLSS